MDKIEFVNLLKKQNIELTDQMINQFDMYFNLIVKYNKVMDLTAVSDVDIFIILYLLLLMITLIIKVYVM